MASSRFSDLQVDPLVTRFLQLGAATEARLPMEEIIPIATTGAWDIKWFEWGLERFKHFDTRRGMRAPYGRSDFGHKVRTASMTRFGFAHSLDTLELQIANPNLNLRAKATGFAREIVRQDLELLKADFLLDNANYDAGHIISLGAGAGWDASTGDPRDDIRQAASLLNASIRVQRRDLTVFLSDSALEAAMNSPAWFGVADLLTENFGDLTRLANFLGVKRIWSANPQKLSDDETKLEDMFPDFALVYVESDSSILRTFDTRWGSDMRWAVDWSMDGGRAGVPWFDPENTTNNWPWDQTSSVQLINGGAAVRIDGIKE